MKLAVKANDWGQRKRHALLSVLLALVPLAAHADRWLIEDSVTTRLESNDNTALTKPSAGTVNTLYLSGALDASIQRENAVTRLKTDGTAVRQAGTSAQSRFDGQLALSHSLSDLLNTFNVSLRYGQDFNNQVTNADVTQGQGQRRTTLLSAAWTRALSERLSADTQLSTERAAYGAEIASAVGYRNSTSSIGLSYALTELTSLALQASHSNYVAADDRNQSKTDSVNVSLSSTVSQRASGAISFGAYQTASTSVGFRLACPLAVLLCEAGLVPFEVVKQSLGTSRRGLQFSASYRLGLDEVMDSSFSVARQQAPSGVGTLVRSDTLTLGVNRRFSPTLIGSMNYARSRSSFEDGFSNASPAQSRLSVSLTKQLADDLSFQMSYQHSQAHSTVFGNPRSNSVSISLQYDGPRIDSSH